MEKVSKHVSFPFRLDMRPYWADPAPDPAPTPTAAAAAAAAAPTSTVTETDAPELAATAAAAVAAVVEAVGVPPIYELYMMCVLLFFHSSN
jgi:hypothetical protein